MTKYKIDLDVCSKHLDKVDTQIALQFALVERMEALVEEVANIAKLLEEVTRK